MLLIRSDIYAVRPIDKALLYLVKNGGRGQPLLKNGDVDVGAHYRQRCLRTAVWPILQDICANTGSARTHWDRLFLASKQGLAVGVLSLVLATVAMQFCYFLSAAITVFMDNLEPAKAPSEEFL